MERQEKGEPERRGTQVREQRWGGKRGKDSGVGGTCVRARYIERETSATRCGRQPARGRNKSMMSVTTKGMEQEVVDGREWLELEVRRTKGRDSREKRERRHGEGRRGRQRD